MPITTTILQDTDEYLLIEETDPSIGYRGLRVEPKRGTPEANRAAVKAKLRAARPEAKRLSTAKEWQSLSPPQQLAAIPALLQMVANLTALVLDDVPDEGA